MKSVKPWQCPVCRTVMQTTGGAFIEKGDWDGKQYDQHEGNIDTFRCPTCGVEIGILNGRMPLENDWGSETIALGDACAALVAYLNDPEHQEQLDMKCGSETDGNISGLDLLVHQLHKALEPFPDRFDANDKPLPTGECGNPTIHYPAYVNVLLCDRAYGGPEEGGWYYDTHQRVDCRVVFDEEEAKEVVAEYQQKYSNEGRPEISSVLSRGRYWVGLQQTIAPLHEPETRPHYE